MLYITYVGILHFGFIDGVYIKYGGKKIGDINKEDFTVINKSLFAFQILVVALGLFVSPMIKDSFLIIALLCVLPTNMLMLYRLIFQATGEFKSYRKVLNTQSIGVFIFDMIALFVFKIDDAKVYCVIYFVLSVLIWAWFTYSIRKMFTKVQLSLLRMITLTKEYIWIGFIIMLGNFMSVWIASIDRWFVKLLCGESDFAYYSFAVSLLKLVNVVFTAFSVTLYNYFCDHHELKQVVSIRRKILIIGSIVISCSFAFRFVIESFLQKYIPAESVMLLLIGSQLFVVLVNSIYLNLYKALNLQKRYLMIMIETSVVAVLLNILLGILMNNKMESFAYATFITMIIWVLLCQHDLKEYTLDAREWLFIVTDIIIFFTANIVSGRLSRSIMGIGIIGTAFGIGFYLSGVIIISVILLKKDFLELFQKSRLILSDKLGIDDR